MNREFRRLALKKIAETTGASVANTLSSNGNKVKEIITLARIFKDAGGLTSHVEKKLNVSPSEVEPSDFKSKFLKLKAGPERENLVFQEVIKRGPSTFGNLVPITVDGPGGTKITYKAMARPITIDGFRVPMAGQTLQKIADHFGMSLPTSKITEQIWDEAGKTGGQIAAKPLSGSGVTFSDGQRFTAKQVVENLISDSRSADAYNKIMDDYIANMFKGKEPDLIAGEGKTIVLTDRPEKLGLYGARDSKGNVIQTSEYTPHDTSVHSEYMTFGRLLGGDVTITFQSGKTIPSTMDKVLNHPKLYKAISNSKVKKYTL